MQQQPESGDFSHDFRNAVNWLYLLANAHATCLTMFIRHSFGTNVPGLSGVFAVIMMLLAVAESNDIRMLWFLYAWIAALICQRMRTGFLCLRGHREHSEYSGWPWLAMRIPFMKSESQAKNSEPTLCLVIGPLLCPVSPTVGMFVMAGVVSLTIVRCMNQYAISRQVTAMRDMQFEQQAMSERMRGLRNDY